MGERFVYLTKYVTGARDQVQRLKVVGESQWGLRLEGFESYTSFEIGKDVFESWPEAKADAERRLARKIASVEKQLAALKAKTFREPKP